MHLPATNLPNSVMVVPILVGASIMFIFTIHHLISDITALFNGKSGGAAKEDR